MARRPRANRLDLPIGELAPDEINVVVEIPQGSHNKYEYDKVLDIFRLDRTLHSPIYYPGDYGFAPRTLAEDDDPHAALETWRVVSRRQPTEGEWRDLRFAWDVVRHVKSNGVVMVRDGVTRGICAGQTNRVSAVRIAGVRAAYETAEGAEGLGCASDGFFPFADGLEEAAAAGCSAVIAPQGSIRDGEVIAAADERDVALVFSTHRYFLH